MRIDVENRQHIISADKINNHYKIFAYLLSTSEQQQKQAKRVPCYSGHTSSIAGPRGQPRKYSAILAKIYWAKKKLAIIEQVRGHRLDCAFSSRRAMLQTLRHWGIFVRSQTLHRHKIHITDKLCYTKLERESASHSFY